MFSNTTTATNLKKGKKKKRGKRGGQALSSQASCSSSSSLPSLRVYLTLQSFPIPTPNPPPKSLTTAKETKRGKKKFSSPRPGGRSASLLFGANPPSPVTSLALRANRCAVGGGCGGRRGGGSGAGPSSPARRASWGAGGDCPI